MRKLRSLGLTTLILMASTNAFSSAEQAIEDTARNTFNACVTAGKILLRELKTEEKEKIKKEYSGKKRDELNNNCENLHSQWERGEIDQEVFGSKIAKLEEALLYLPEEEKKNNSRVEEKKISEEEQKKYEDELGVQLVRLSNAALMKIAADKKWELRDKISLDLSAKNRKGEKAFTISNVRVAVHKNNELYGNFSKNHKIFTFKNWTSDQVHGKTSCEGTFEFSGIQIDFLNTCSFKLYGKSFNYYHFKNGNNKSIENIAFYKGADD